MAEMADRFVATLICPPVQFFNSTIAEEKTHQDLVGTVRNNKVYTDNSQGNGAAQLRSNAEAKLMTLTIFLLYRVDSAHIHEADANRTEAGRGEPVETCPKWSEV